jgi:hypothetical protein
MRKKCDTGKAFPGNPQMRSASRPRRAGVREGSELEKLPEEERKM